MLVNEIFQSIQGEGRWIGYPTIFIRTSGCNLECVFCDTEHLKGVQMSTQTIIQSIRKFPDYQKCRIVITGGEPYLQKSLESLCISLLKKGFNVGIETNGTLMYTIPGVWVTCSPKSTRFDIDVPKELKFLYGRANVDKVWDIFKFSEDYKKFKERGLIYLQPVLGYDDRSNRMSIHKTMEEARHWGLPLSPQIHKYLEVK